jgi:uncharacterized protein (DUF433 family)
MVLFQRISHDPKIMGGKVCIKGTRVTVGLLVTLISEGKTFDSLLDEYFLFLLSGVFW